MGLPLFSNEGGNAYVLTTNVWSSLCWMFSKMYERSLLISGINMRMEDGYAVFVEWGLVAGRVFSCEERESVCSLCYVAALLMIRLS